MPASLVVQRHRSNGFSFGKMVTFILATVLGSLLQLVIVAPAVFLILQRPIEMGKLLGDGGLLFFATSLCVSGALQLVDKRKLVFGRADLNVLLVAMVFFFLLPILTYAVVMPRHLTANPPPVSPPFFHLVWLQIACGFGAFVFSFFVAVRTGRFAR